MQTEEVFKFLVLGDHYLHLDYFPHVCYNHKVSVIVSSGSFQLFIYLGNLEGHFY